MPIPEASRISAEAGAQTEDALEPYSTRTVCLAEGHGQQYGICSRSGAKPTTAAQEAPEDATHLQLADARHDGDRYGTIVGILWIRRSRWR